MRQLNVHKLVKNLNNLCNYLSDIYNINCGGCCYVAYEIAKHLDRFNLSYELHILNDYPISKRKINEKIDLISGNNTCCHYYLVVHGGGAINRGDFDTEYYTYVVPNINHRNLNWIYRVSKWNSTYKRKNNKLIKKVISLYFKQYGKASKSNLCSCKSSPMS